MTQNNTIGKLVGKVKKTVKVSQYKGGPSTQITVWIDFSHSTDEEIRNWLASDRAIAGQRPWRTLTIEEIDALDGQTFHASTIGTKVKSREDKIMDLVKAGLSRELAEFSVDNPDVFAQAVMNEKTKRSATKGQDELDTLEETN
jgi:hypothetical protein